MAAETITVVVHFQSFEPDGDAHLEPWVATRRWAAANPIVICVPPECTADDVIVLGLTKSLVATLPHARLFACDLGGVIVPQLDGDRALFHALPPQSTAGEWLRASLDECPRSVPRFAFGRSDELECVDVFRYRLPVKRTVETAVHVMLTTAIPEPLVHASLSPYHAATYLATGRGQNEQRKAARARAAEVSERREVVVERITVTQEAEARMRRLRCHGSR